MKVNLDGKELDFNLVRSNFLKEIVGFFPGVLEDDITDALVKYDSSTNTVAVDERVSDSYAKYAAVHECICQGPYHNLAPSTDDPNKRCGLIDKMLIESMSEPEKKAYITKRIEMFKTLIEKKLNPPLESMFRESIEMLNHLNVSLYGGGDKHDGISRR